MTDPRRNQIIGAVLREVRNDLGWSLAHAQTVTAIRGTTIASYERGERTVTASRLIELARSYQVNALQLVEVIERRCQMARAA